MALPLESVPNFSEGRDRATIDALADALGEHAELLDVHADADHNRSVFTLVGEETSSSRPSLAGIACARERIDLRRHEGAHPRIGAADVVPLVPIVPEDMPRAQDAAREALAGGSATSSGCRSSSTASWRRAAGPAFFRRGGPDELQRRIDAGRADAGLRARAARTRPPGPCSSARAGR